MENEKLPKGYYRSTFPSTTSSTSSSTSPAYLVKISDPELLEKIRETCNFLDRVLKERKKDKLKLLWISRFFLRKEEAKIRHYLRSYKKAIKI